MGYASHEGKAWAIGRLMELGLPQAPTFLDLGAGAGSWMEAVRPWFLDSKWIAVEAWPAYVERFCLTERYQLTRIGDIRELSFNEADVVILGDVIEHMPKEDAQLVWERACKAARKAVVMSTPIIDYPQGHVHGNPLQEHVHCWSHEEVMRDLPWITHSTVGDVVGTYIVT